MVKVTDAINVIVKENLLYSFIINSGLANYTSLARRIKSQVEFLTGKDVKINTIVKTLTGLTIKEQDTKASDVLKKSSLSVEYKYTEKYYDDLKDVSSNAMLVVREKDKFKCIFQSGDSNDLALIRITMSPEASGIPGITLLLTEYLSIYDIKVRNIYRLDTEIWITVSVRDAGLITDHLSKLLYNSQM